MSAAEKIRHALAFRRRARLILRAGDDDAGGGDMFQQRQLVGAAEDHPAQRHDAFAQALGGQALQMGQQRLRQRSGHVVGIELRGDIFQQRRRDGAGLFHGGQHAHIALPRLRRFVAQVAVQQRQHFHPLRRQRRQFGAPHAADGQADDAELFNIQMIHQRQMIGGDIRQAVSPGRQRR
ncbi:Uncharacterised protein [Acinetobacter baumannii]|nr:Uncharacterised protein [Acinetobacter baumannii]